MGIGVRIFRNLVALGSVSVLVFLCTGCTARAPLSDVFASTATSVDALPEADNLTLSGGIEASSARSLGEDTAGNRYFVVQASDSTETCLLVYFSDGLVGSGCGEQLPVQFGVRDFEAELVSEIPSPIPVGSESVGDHVIATLQSN